MPPPCRCAIHTPLVLAHDPLAEAMEPRRSAHSSRQNLNMALHRAGMDNVTQAGSGRAGAGFVQASQSDLLLALKQALSDSFRPATRAQGIEAAACY